MPETPYIIGISGGSASGKTTIAKTLYHLLGDNNCTYISLDNYYHDISIHSLPEKEINFDHPDSIDLKLFESQLKALKQGEEVNGPVYDFATHTRRNNTFRYFPRTFIIIEGLFLFTQVADSSVFNKRIFVDAPDDIRLIRRIERDTSERGRNLASVLSQYLHFVRPMYHSFVKQNSAYAHIIIDTFKHSKKELDRILEDLVAQLKC